MDEQVVVTSETLLSLTVATAVRQLTRFGVGSREFDSLRGRLRSLADDAEGTIKAAAAEETQVLREMINEGEDLPHAELLLLLSIYADAGVSIACQIQRQRIAEAN